MPSDFFYVLVGDCGGTNTRLTLWQIAEHSSAPQQGERAPGTAVFKKKYANESYPNIVAIVKIFLQESGAHGTPKTACLACAGPIIRNKVDFTNIASGWSINGHDLETELNIERVVLVNDFAAMGYGLLTLSENDYVTLNEGEAQLGMPIATVGAGTGLGECFLTKDPNSPASSYVCWPTEGGHTDFAPRNELELNLLRFLRAKHALRHRISHERVISGPGIASIYEFLASKYPEQVDADLHAAWLAAPVSQKSHLISVNAKAKSPLFKQAMDIFFSSYASECGNACLKWLPYGGFYLTGGIIAKNFDLLDISAFMDVLFDKGRIAGCLKSIPIRACKTEDIGERGAHLLAYNLTTHH